MQKMIFLILSVAIMAGCAGCATGLPKPPVKQVRMLDVDHQVCGLYDVTPTTGRPRYDFVRDISMSECDGSVCLAPLDYKKMENWALNVRDNYTCKLKE